MPTARLSLLYREAGAPATLRLILMVSTTKPQTLLPFSKHLITTINMGHVGCFYSCNSILGWRIHFCHPYPGTERIEKFYLYFGTTLI